MRKFALITTALALAATAYSEEDGTITLSLGEFRNGKGVVVCSLFDKAAPFPKSHDQAVSSAKVRVSGKTATCVFTNVKPGTYAIAGFHDENSNGKLDMGVFGPAEGWFASRDARATFSPPHFKDAKIDYEGGALELTARIAN